MLWKALSFSDVIGDRTERYAASKKDMIAKIKKNVGVIDWNIRSRPGRGVQEKKPDGLGVYS